MKDRTTDKFWFPWWPDKWIFGSIRIEFSPAERGIWVDMLSLASKDDGHIRANETTPYPIQQLAGMLIIPENILIEAIEKFIKYEKITRTKQGTLYVTKWDKYQFTDRHKRRINAEMSEESDTMSAEKDAILNKSIENNITENNKKEDNTKNNNVPHPIDIELAQLLIDRILENDVRSSGVQRMTEANQRSWIDDCRKIREIDKRTPDEIRAIIEWCQKDEFWRGNILSMATLRRKFDQLYLKAQNQLGKSDFSGIQEWLKEMSESNG